MGIQVKKFGIRAIYKVGGKHEIWYFTRTQRDRMLFEMTRQPEIISVKPMRR